MLSKGPLVRARRKQNCGARKPAQAPRKTRYARKQNVCARKQNTSNGVSISLFGAGCKTFRTWLMCGLGWRQGTCDICGCKQLLWEEKKH